MDNARIIIIEDDPMIMDVCRRNLEVKNHRIIGEAATVAAAIDLVDSLKSEDIDLAVVDGNLTHGARGGDEGEHITALIHQKLPGVVVVGSSLDGGVRGSDIDVPKGDAWALDALVTELPNRPE